MSEIEPKAREAALRAAREVMHLAKDTPNSSADTPAIVAITAYLASRATAPVGVEIVDHLQLAGDDIKRLEREVAQLTRERDEALRHVELLREKNKDAHRRVQRAEAAQQATIAWASSWRDYFRSPKPRKERHLFSFVLRDIRRRIQKTADKYDALYPASAIEQLTRDMAEVVGNSAHLLHQLETVTRERDEALARIAEIENHAPTHRQFRLSWDAPPRPPAHPVAMRGVQTFSTYEAAMKVMAQQAGAVFVSLIQIDSYSKDRSVDLSAALSEKQENTNGR